MCSLVTRRDAVEIKEVKFSLSLEGTILMIAPEFFLISKYLFYFFECIDECMYVYQVSVVVLGGQKSPHEGWELNQSLLKDQQVFLPAEPSFQALGFSYK